MGAASDRDQEHQREDHGTGGDELAAQNPQMHGDPAGQRERKRRQQRDAPIAHDQPRDAVAKIANAADGDRKGEHARGAHGLRHRGIECRGIRGLRHRRQRPGVEQAETVQQREPGFYCQDCEVGGVVEILLRLAGIHGERTVDHHEIHIGIAPVDDETSRTARTKPRARQ